MRKWIDKYQKLLKIIIMIFAYGYLAYILYSFDGYKEFANSFRDFNLMQGLLLLFCFVLIPLNWLIEGFKWKILAGILQDLSITKAFKSVLIGLTTGFFTPNRVGDPFGRVIYLAPDNQARGIVLSLLNNLGQTFATIFGGGVAAIILAFSPLAHKLPEGFDFKTSSIFGLALIVFIYFTLPYWCRKLLKKYNFAKKTTQFLQALSSVSFTKLWNITWLSVVRYTVYVFQFYLMLLFFNVNISIGTAYIAIPINYLLASIAPSVAFSEMGIRGSSAAICIGMFTPNTVGAMLAGISIWLINYVIPMITGSIFLAKTDKLVDKKFY